MNEPHDYYRILHVAPDAPEAIIKSSYRTLMQRLRQHPDLGGDHETAVLINEAHDALIDPEKRAAHDRQRQTRRPLKKPAARGRSVPQTAEALRKPSRRSPGGCLFCRAPIRPGSTISAGTLCDDCRSPLSLPPPHALENSGLRTVNRFAKQQPITFYTSWPLVQMYSGDSQNISLQGMQLITRHPLHEREIIKIDSAACRAVGRVAHIEQSGNFFVVGVEFLALRFEHTQGSFVSTHA